MLETVDTAKGVIDRRIFSDPDIYELELERIFARAWNFMAHDSQIPNPGDFFMTFIGEDRVIVVRDNDGNPQVLVNSCRHRGNAICRAEEGHATSFMCTYHGWTYDLKGALVGVPGFKEVYHEELDRDNWGLIKAAQIDSFKGFIFATMDSEAPGLEDYLGDLGRIFIDMLASKGEILAFGGIQKFKIPCNWKLAVDNIWDFYHVRTTHASAYMSRTSPTGDSPAEQSSLFAGKPHAVLLGEYGHAIIGHISSPEKQAKKALKREAAKSRGESSDAREALGVDIAAHGSPHLFPNVSISSYHLGLRLPKGPTRTEVWRFAFQVKDHSVDKNGAIRQRAVATTGPAGMLEQDDSENWQQSTRGALGAVTMRYPLNYTMGLGHGEIIDDEGHPPRIETPVSEHPQRWMYQAWSEWLTAESWSELKATHSPVPGGVI